jgi:hypothetical protein
MKSLVIMAALAFATIATPTIAASKAPAMVFDFKGPDGRVRQIPIMIPGNTASLDECERLFPTVAPRLAKQLNATNNFSKADGWKYRGAKCAFAVPE